MCSYRRTAHNQGGAFAEPASRGLLASHPEKGTNLTAEEPSHTLGVAEVLKEHH